MHSAPAVQFPIQRSRFQAWFLAVVVAAGALVNVGWLAYFDVTGWRMYLAGVVVGAGCLLALRVSLGSQASGQLHWDGAGWHLETPGSSASGQVAVHIDLQFFLLLSLRTDAGDVRWFWLDRPPVRAPWEAFRRALWSPQGRGDSATHDDVGSQRVVRA